MHSKRHYKIYIRSVFLGEIRVFSKFRGILYYFPENVLSILSILLRRWEFFWFLFPLHFCVQKKGLGFFFSKKNSLNWGVKCMKFKLQKIVGNLLELASKTVHEWNDHVEIISRPQVIENWGQYLLLRTDILQKTVVGKKIQIFLNSTTRFKQFSESKKAKLPVHKTKRTSLGTWTRPAIAG